MRFSRHHTESQAPCDLKQKTCLLYSLHDGRSNLSRMEDKHYRAHY